MLMKADPLKQRKITTMFQAKPINVQETLSEEQELNDIEDFGENEDNNLVEIGPRPMVTKKRKRDPSPIIDARNWKEALGPSPPASDVKVCTFLKYIMNYDLFKLTCLLLHKSLVVMFVNN